MDTGDARVTGCMEQGGVRRYKGGDEINTLTSEDGITEPWKIAVVKFNTFCMCVDTGRTVWDARFLLRGTDNTYAQKCRMYMTVIGLEDTGLQGRTLPEFSWASPQLL